MDISEFGVNVLDSKSCFLLAEAQSEFSMHDFVDDVNLSEKNVDRKDEGECKKTVVAVSADKYKYTTAIGVNEHKNCKNVLPSTENAVAMESSWKPSEPLLAYNTDMGAEAENVLIPEISRTNSVDCSNFADFNEFNLCLNNILNYDDDDVITQSLSPITIIPTDNMIHTGAMSCSSSPKLCRSTQDSADSWNQRLTPRSGDQLQNIFDIVQLSEGMDLQTFQSDEKIQPQSFSTESESHIVPAAGLTKDKFGGYQERQIT